MDSIPKIVYCLKAAAREVGVPEPCTKAAAAVIGLSLDVAMSTLFPAHLEQKRLLVLAYQKAYKAGNNIESPLFAGTEPMLHRLQQEGAMLAIATGKSRQGLNRVLAQTGLEEVFVTSRTADEASSKPSADMLQQIIAEQGINPEQVVMVGDSLLDMKMAQNANVDAVAMSWGAADKSALSSTHALATCDNYEQLLMILGCQNVNTMMR